MQSLPTIIQVSEKSNVNGIFENYIFIVLISMKWRESGSWKASFLI